MKLIDIAKGSARRLFRGRVKGLGLVLAGAALASAPAAHAQFGVAVQFGGPRYVAPAPAYRPYVAGYYGPAYVGPRYGYGYGPGYYDWHRAEAWRAHEYWAHHYRPYGRPYRGY